MRGLFWGDVLLDEQEPEIVLVLVSKHESVLPFEIPNDIVIAVRPVWATIVYPREVQVSYSGNSF